MINIARHHTVFDPRTFAGNRVDVIGVGALGSRLTLELARLGIDGIHVWDPDTVSDVNLGNQAFAKQDVGVKKVHALARLVKEHTGAALVTHEEACQGEQELGEVIFLMTDSLASRREVFQAAIRFNLTTKRLIEARLGIDQGRAYSLDPNQGTEVEAYARTLNGVAKAAVNSCGSPISVGATAGTAVSIATWMFIRWWAREQDKTTDELENEVIFALRPVMVTSRSFTRA
ncbi:ThiF family adenylyltransferase [Candidatus Uhrbacteria bacterium]|nr:ThiF family adenylyltransferase [Candidatus Uhrbacteria bacterium]